MNEPDMKELVAQAVASGHVEETAGGKFRLTEGGRALLNAHVLPEARARATAQLPGLVIAWAKWRVRQCDAGDGLSPEEQALVGFAALVATERL
jgi:hypothetical protein